MIKLTILYNTPADKVAFDDYYFAKHMPLARALPNVQRAEAGRVLDSDTVHVAAELWFADGEAMAASFGSDEGKAVIADVANFGAAGATQFVSEIVEP